MHLVRKASGALLNFLELLGNWLEGLLNLRGVDWKFFCKAHRSSVKLVAQQTYQAHACKHYGRRATLRGRCSFSRRTTTGSNRIERNAARITVMQIELA